MKKRILIIDDDKQLNQINQKVLLASGFVSELHITLNGREALTYLTTRIEKDYPLPDFIILDLHMPVMDGFSFIEEFRKLNCPNLYRTEIVVFTSSSSQKDRQRVMSQDVKHFLSKPYLLRGLTDIVKNPRINQHEVSLYKTGF
jgi:CheY-like chemotaxis protein